MIEYKAVIILNFPFNNFFQKRDENLMLLLPAYFILAEAYISDKNTEEKEVRLKSAEDFLFGAYVAYTKHKDLMSGE